jgi:uncharacterized phiE125 gp8 family phage protein
MREDFCWWWWDRDRQRARDINKSYGTRPVGLPAGEPISLQEAWFHLRIDTFGSPPASDDDAWLTDIGIPAARDWCEQYLGGSIAPQTIELATQGFPSGSIPLPFGPVLSISSVIYTDANGDDQTLVADTDYMLDAFVRPPVVRPAYGASWPSARASVNSVRVQYVTGYSLPDESPQTNPLPAGIRAAMLLMLGHFYNNRENSLAEYRITIQAVPNGADTLLERYRIRLSMA